MNHISEILNKNIIVFGLAKSGYETAKILHKYGAKVTVTFSEKNITSTIQQQIDELMQLGIVVYVNEQPQSLLVDCDLIVKNPGIPYQVPFLQEAMHHHINIITEIELAYVLSKAPIVAITGTNGKTTTTTLIGEMFNYSQKTAKLGGNIGYVACKVADETNVEDTLVLEVSSFQLQGTQHFKPHIAIITNLGSAHLDYHQQLEHYYQAKHRIFSQQTSDDYVILNGKQLAMFDKTNIKAQIIPFYTNDKIKEGIWIEKDAIVYDNEQVCHLSDILVPGEHNLENILAAIAAAKLCQVDNDSIVKALHNFKGVAHRLEYVGNYHGVTYYNDSKSTNYIATQTALTALKSHSVILLCGGFERQEDNKELIPYFKNLPAVICYGATKKTMAQRAREASVPLIYEVDELEEAVNIAIKIAQPNDTVLLSPSCASWDQYVNFEARGEAFKNFVYDKVGK